MAKTITYREIAEKDVPAKLRWDTPPQNAGQIVTVMYADAYPGAAPACHGSLYRRTFDASDRTTTYAKREAGR